MQRSPHGLWGESCKSRDHHCRPWRTHLEASSGRTAAHGKDPGRSRTQHGEKGQADRSCSGLTPNPVPLHQGWDGKAVNEGATMNLGRRRRRGRCIRFFSLLLTIQLYFSCQENLFSSSHVQFSPDSKWQVVSFSLFWQTSVFLFFSFLFLLR